MRKSPRQARAKETVERIVTAGRAVLVEDGYDAFSTNRVAARAQVSPGSLYQYFPDKAAILDVVLDRYWAEVADRVARSLADRVASPEPASPTLVRQTADALVAALEADRALLRVVAEVLPLQRSRERRAALENRVAELATVYLAARSGTRRPVPAHAAWVLVLAFETLASRWVLDQPPSLSREELVDEMTALAVGYLQV
ncbi:TetR/AcrR family transcriptional regulator [Nocardioides sp. zg-536]|uniref:TetR/AcrR family transcriptional regulator n=1 Tax=Nocardioides faecalis TaxID=2803858 RepID=A0A939BY47_9ACTN|nr:TetR/AcrR family transcriptional regulator [Nocardioides faecalis]MBM9459535.1 TetR/AcrR family transcriptional regulator [Nocardioides faecalis]MBS4753685.1 TetR/AcrR family transcriptional regulator [Nocardioides faecalis]QVI58068.1 TetR/AcrR family transcriptional regulator [Nocardioides faecalis]